MVGDILQPTHLIFVLVVALLVLGPKRLPEAGKALGKGLRDFRSAMSGEEHHGEIPASAPAVQTVSAPAPVVATPAATPAAPQMVAQSQGTDPMEPAHAETAEPAPPVHTAS